MKRIIRLNESQLVKIVEKVISEQTDSDFITYSSVIEIPDKNKDEIYDKIKLYLVESYNNFREVVQLDDKNNGTIILKATMRFVNAGPYYEGWIDYSLKITIKDGKFKIEMKDLNHETHNIKGKLPLGPLTRNPNFTDKGWLKNQTNNAWKVMKEYSANYFKRMVMSLTEFVKTGKQDDFQP